MDKKASNTPRRGQGRNSPPTGRSSRRPGRDGWLKEQSPRLDPAPAALAGPAGKGRRNPRPQASRRRRSDLFAIARLVSFGLLLFLTARLAIMAWEAVDSRRAELFRQEEVAETPFQRLPVLPGGQDSWADASLAGTIQKAITPPAGTTAVYVKGLNTGATATVQENRVYPSASLFKVPILVEVLRQQSLGLSTMNTPVRLQQKHWADGAGVLQAQIGKEYPVGELLDLMIRVSDNVAALALLDLVDTDNVNLTLQANGLEETRLRIGDTRRNWGGRPGENTTTAGEMGILLEKIATGKILNEQASEEAVRLLSLQQQAAWLPTLLPSRVKVAHKSGELPGVRHDAGIVYGPRSQFITVVLTSEITRYDSAAESIARVARNAYDYFETGVNR